MADLTLFVLVICFATFATAQKAVSSQTSEVSSADEVGDITKPEVTFWDYQVERTKDGFLYQYHTSDSSYRRQEAVILNPGTDKEELVIKGTYTYRSGAFETVVEYTADKNGYRSQTHLTWSPIAYISPKLLGSLAG